MKNTKRSSAIPAHIARRHSLLNFRATSLALLERQADQHLALCALYTWSDGNSATCARWIGVLISVLKELGELIGDVAAMSMPAEIKGKASSGGDGVCDDDDGWASDLETTLLEDASLLDATNSKQSSKPRISGIDSVPAISAPYNHLLATFSAYIAEVRAAWVARDVTSQLDTSTAPPVLELPTFTKVVIRTTADTLARLAARLAALPPASAAIPAPESARYQWSTTQRRPARAATAFSPSKSMGTLSGAPALRTRSRVGCAARGPSSTRSVVGGDIAAGAELRPPPARSESPIREELVAAQAQTQVYEQAIPLRVLSLCVALVAGMQNEVQAMREIEWEVLAGEAALRA